MTAKILLMLAFISMSVQALAAPTACGKILFFNENKGIGFIVEDKTGEHILLFYPQILSSELSYDEIEAGTSVCFDKVSRKSSSSQHQVGNLYRP